MNTPVDHRIKERWEKVEERYEGNKNSVHAILTLYRVWNPFVPTRLKDLAILYSFILRLFVWRMSREKTIPGTILELSSILECHEVGAEIYFGVPDPKLGSNVVSVKLHRLLGDIHEFCYFPGIHILCYEICHPDFFGCEVKDPGCDPVGKG